MSCDPVILFCAFRYALGRSTYVVSNVTEAIQQNWSVMSEGQKQQFVDEILEYKQKYGKIGHKIDEKEWMKIVERFKEEQDRTV